MFRSILAAISGYIVMFLIVMLGFAACWLGLGSEFAFEENTTTASLGLTLCSLVSGLFAAIVGGRVAAMIGGRYGKRAVNVLAGMILVLGALSAIGQSFVEPTPLPAGVSVSDLEFVDAGTYAVSPPWYHYAIPVVGIVGVLIGGRCCSGRRQSEPVQLTDTSN